MIHLAEPIRDAEQSFCRDNEQAITDVRNRLRGLGCRLETPAQANRTDDRLELR